ncbi:hypothetical protein [Mesonia maritima]|uniref:Uncharacterized protein n=1 Tax=Mesonia maritima TaxID=1793873 RepID=A0ABU1K3Z4_9FLAO|nr:hypothetical protein [Mesonia maritima]MDR6300036.1 hypothetical protein [Mesonia maritima]
MKKALFYFCGFIAIILFINILKIVFTDLSRLTEYGYGYLVGKIILFIVFSGIVILLKRKIDFSSK